MDVDTIGMAKFHTTLGRSKALGDIMRSITEACAGDAEIDSKSGLQQLELMTNPTPSGSHIRVVFAFGCGARSVVLSLGCCLCFCFCFGFWCVLL